MARDQILFDEAMQKANNLAWDARWQEAAREYERALAEFPDDLMAHLNLGMALLELHRLPDALTHYQHASTLAPDDPLPLQKVAQIQEQIGQREQAVANYASLAKLLEARHAVTQALSTWQKVVILAPDNVEAHAKLAQGYLRREQLAEAANEYLAAAIACRDNGNIPEAIGYCDKALALDRYHEKARALRERLSLGESLEAVKHGVASVDSEQSPMAVATHQAISRLADLIFDAQAQEPAASRDLADFDSTGSASAQARMAADRQRVVALIGRAVDLQTRGVLDKAIEAYGSALDLGVDYPEIKFCLGVLYYKAMRYDKAIAFFQEAASLADYALASYFALGQCYRAEGQLEEALQSYLRLLHLLSSQKGLADADGILQLYGSLMGTQGKVKDRDRAVAFIDAITSFLSGKGWEKRLRQAHEHIKSLATSEVAISLADIVEVPGSDRVLEGLRRSQEYLQEDLPMAAIEECYWILDIADTYLPIHTHLAEVFVKQDKLDQAMAKYAVVASAYEIRGDAKQAINTYRRVLELAPMDISVRPKLIALLTSRGQIDQAIEEYVALAEAYHNRIQVDKAIQEYKEALSLAPRGSTDRLWPVLLRKKMAQLYLERLDWNRACAIYEEIKELGDLGEEDQQELIELYYRAGRTGYAETELDEVLGALCDGGRQAEAMGLLRRLEEIRGEDDGLRKRKARVLLKSGQKEQAIAELDALGERQLEQGQLEEAIATVQEIIAMDPDEVQGYRRLLQQLVKQHGSGNKELEGA